MSDALEEFKYRKAVAWVIENQNTSPMQLADGLGISCAAAEAHLGKMEAQEILSGPLFIASNRTIQADLLSDLPFLYRTDALLPHEILGQLSEHLAQQGDASSLELLRSLQHLKPGQLDEKRHYANAALIPVVLEG